ncbi:hypothetical protein SAMN04488012_104298 [Palleronia salina]|uniref:Uncharacterized protein n=1 Tax=Palleronia salina TaxID=313368 RepID=A0A1M6GDD6_9RHOB|nr:hypothetical protein SAMN04488012_104298 [Palleronia salina]
MGQLRLGALDALQKDGLARRTELLPMCKIGTLPKPSDHGTQYPLDPQLQTVADGETRRVRSAIAFSWRMALLGGVFTVGDDPGIGEFLSRNRLQELSALRTETFGTKRPSQKTYEGYIRELSRFIISRGGQGLPSNISPVERRWIELRALARKSETLTPARVMNLAAVSTPAKAEGLSLRDLTRDWFAERLAVLPAEKRRAFSSACYTLNELVAIHGRSVDCLPPNCTGVRRKR